MVNNLKLIRCFLIGKISNYSETTTQWMNFLLFLFSEHPYSQYWIGASDQHSEGDFRWVDGTQCSYSST